MLGKKTNQLLFLRNFNNIFSKVECKQNYTVRNRLFALVKIQQK